MATRSTISVKTPEGHFLQVYCHRDGYPQHQMPILTEHYNTLEKALELVKGGDMSYLAPDPSKPEGHSYDTPVKGHVVYYGRDRGETGTEPVKSSTHVGRNVYYYYWFIDGEGWKYFENYCYS